SGGDALGSDRSAAAVDAAAVDPAADGAGESALDAAGASSSRSGSSDAAVDAAGLPEPVDLVAALSGGGFFLAITRDYQRKRVPMRVSRCSCRPC
ncbi:MAG: hypothetical protein ACREBE_11465, partial [bacterium]